MQAAIYLGVAAACYVAAWGWVVVFIDAWRRRHWAGITGLLVAGAVALAIGFTGSMVPAVRALASCAIGLAGVGAYYGLVLRVIDDWKWRKLRREDARQVALHLILLTGGLFFALPYFWMIVTSLKPDDAIFKNPTSLPEVWKWGNYPRTFLFMETALGHIKSGFGSLFLMNTLEVTVLSLASMLVSSTLVAYSFARLRWPGRDILFALLLGTMMLPGAVTMIPRFLIFKQLGWVDTFLPLWVPSLFAGAFEVFMLRQFMLTIPTELEDAAKIDGAGYFTIYWRVMLPLIKPAIAALAILQFMGIWNDFMGPLIYLSSPEKMTGTYALRLFQSATGSEWGLLLAASTMWTLPVVLLFFFAQRAFIQGIALTGMKN